MAYASASDVAVLCRSIMGSSASFDTATCPTLAQVTAWLTSGCSIIEAGLGEQGYGAIPTTSVAYGFAQQVNALWAAAFVEESRLSSILTDTQRTRGELFMRQFDKLLQRLIDLDLSRLGVTQTGKVYAGGISRSDKQAVDSNTDRVPSRFARGQFRNPLGVTQEPGIDTSAS